MDLLDAFLYLLGPWPLFLCVLGTALGIIVGAIPGLSGAMLIALTLPLTFKMVPEQAMALIVCMYTGSITGGLVSAVLLRIPGTPSNVITVFDGYAMAQKGQAGRALGLGVASSEADLPWRWVFGRFQSAGLPQDRICAICVAVYRVAHLLQLTKQRQLVGAIYQVSAVVGS